MTKLHSRLAVASIAVAAVGGLLSACGAPGGTGDDQDAYPQKTIDVVVPYPAGGGSDVIARALVDEINAGGNLEYDLQVVNKAGGAGIVGLTEMINSKADGYTISISPSGPVSLHPAMADVAYDPMTDLTFIAGLTRGGALIAVPGSSPYQTIEDLVAAAKANPGTITMGEGPPAYQIPLALLESATGAEFSHVDFDGDAATTTAILGGNIDATLTQTAAAIPQVAAGTMRVLATVGSERSALLPDVPTLAESDIDVDFEAPYGVYAPAGVPDEVVETLAAEVQTAVESKALKEKASAAGLELKFSSGADLKKTSEALLESVAKLKESGAV